MLQAKEIKNGAIVVFNEAPVIIESISVQSPSARGAATLYKFRGRNVVTKQKVDITLKGSEGLPEADFQRRQVKIMYSDATHMHIMDQEDYNQYSLPLEDLQHERNFITDALEGILGLVYNDECVGMQIPNTVELEVTECDPGVKGNSATSRTKPATLETGYIVQVPEYLKQGERVKVDTRSGDFLSRA
ncbi:MAG: elongation factor P [Pirellulaceae bacterium]|nr:elongation factor P [Pirellulaceae bacterium]